MSYSALFVGTVAGFLLSAALILGAAVPATSRRGRSGRSAKG